MKNRYLIFMVISLVLVLMTGGAAAKSLYVLSSHHAKLFEAWNIPAGGVPVSHQGTYNLKYASYPAGVAIHEASKTLFISSESPNLEVVDAETFQSLGQLTGTEFAGVSMDNASNILWAMRRSNNRIYAYDFARTGGVWSLTLRTGFPKILGELYSYSGMGIAVDDTKSPAILWVADGGYMMIRAYDTSTMTEDKSLSFSTAGTQRGAVGMGMDRVRQIIYWGSMNLGAWVPPNSGSYELYKFDLGTRVLTHQYIGHDKQVVDTSVDESTGLVYITETNGMSVWDTTTTPSWSLLQRHSFGSHPATCGLAVSNVTYQPDLKIVKADDVADGDCRIQGELITYTLTYENTGTAALTNVSIIDTLPNPLSGVQEVAFVSASHGGIYNGATHTVSWPPFDLVPGASGAFTVMVSVNLAPSIPTTVTNYVDHISDQTPASTVEAYTAICVPPQQDCDVNTDGAIDIYDILEIGAHRGSTDPLDLARYNMDSDGMVTTNDARICVLDCDNPRCAVSVPIGGK